MKRNRDKCKNEYWNYFCNHKKYHPNGFTKSKLEKIKSDVFNNNFFWDDILNRHRGNEFDPVSLSNLNRELFGHCMSNMSAMIRESLNEKGIL